MLCILAFSPAALANELEAGRVQRYASWAIGVGATYRQSPYRGYANHVSPVPLVIYEDRNLHLHGSSLDFKALSQGGLELAARIKVDIGEGYSPSDSPTFNGMERRRGGVYLGLAGAWENPIADLSLEWLKDVSGHSRGQEAKVELEHGFKVSRSWEVVPLVSADWLDHKYVGYYYGVDPGEVTAVRPNYAGKATLNLKGGIQVRHRFNRNQQVSLEVADTRWGAGLKDSPLVDRASSLGVRLGYLYHF